MTNTSGKTKKQLAQSIVKIIKDNDLTQTEAARIAKDHPSQLSLINTGALRGFSFERLCNILNALGADITVSVKAKKPGRRGKFMVKAA